MSIPESWDWLPGNSNDWEPPEELLQPVQSLESNLAILMLSCETLGHDVLVLLGRFIMEQSLFAIWFVQNVKGSGRSVEETLALTEFGEKQTRLVYESWKNYENSVKSAPSGDKRERVVAAIRR